MTRSFYERPTLVVAEEIIGKIITLDRNDYQMSARIVEVEAYIGESDPACHAARGKTTRNSIMFGRGGFAYVYFIYGMYHCLNFVTEKKGFPAAILLRAAEPIDGLDTHQNAEQKPLGGPGKFCRAFGINLTHNGLDLTKSRLYLRDHESSVTVVKTPRIGISKGKELFWRFCDARSKHLSQPLKSLIR